jgi:hypothetical protein
MDTGLLIAAVLLAGAGESGAQDPRARCDHFQAQALANEIARLTESLDLGADIECREPVFDDSTALIQTARGGSIDAARLLLARGAKVNARDKSGWTALRHARYRHQFLTKAGLDGAALKMELVIELLVAAKATE